MKGRRWRIVFVVLPADAPRVEVLRVEGGHTTFSVPAGEVSYGYVFGTYTAREALRAIRQRFRNLRRGIG